MTVRMWTNENLNCFYHYQEYGSLELDDQPPLEDDPFWLAIQMEWKLEMMVRYEQSEHYP